MSNQLIVGGVYDCPILKQINIIPNKDNTYNFKCNGKDFNSVYSTSAVVLNNNVLLFVNSEAGIELIYNDKIYKATYNRIENTYTTEIGDYHLITRFSENLNCARCIILRPNEKPFRCRPVKLSANCKTDLIFIDL